MSWPGKRTARMLLAVIAAIALPSAALAYWSGTGTGTTSFELGNTIGLTLSAGVPSESLLPGDRAAVSVIVSNPNPFAVHVGSFTLDPASVTPITVDSGHMGCDVSALSYAPQTNGTAGWSVPPDVGSTDGVLTVTLPDALAMSDAAASACQAATFTVALRATA
jgi:hypothetical protein